MPTLFFFLSIIALIGLIIGIIKPSKVKLTSRKKVILWFGGSFIVFIILIGATSPVDKTQLSVQENKPADTTVVADQTPEQLLESSYKAEIKKIGTTKFSYRDMKIEDADNYRPAGSKMVTISVNIDDFYKKDSLIRDTGILSSNLFQKSLDTSIQ
ncbi:MAG TPA: hypothetical protein PLX67_01350 [bacterium]|nr:hypothetical protein [bacterium]